MTTVKCFDAVMQKAQSKLTTQGQVSVPAPVRSFLNLMPGSVLIWTLEDDRVVVERSKRHSTQEVHEVLFPERAAGGEAGKTLTKVKQGIRQRMRSRHLP